MPYPLDSLRRQCWFKLICGASFQHLPAVRSLTLAYGLAGVDCIDVAADQAVVSAVRSALGVVAQLAPEAQQRGHTPQVPWLMVSLNDGDDPHFRKASFDPNRCPLDCPRPCEAVCPAEAIAFEPDRAGVIADRCYGCGRCVPVCPQGYIETQAHQATPQTVAALLAADIDAVEIHTQVGHSRQFRQLWQRTISPHLPRLKLVAVSCPAGEGVTDYLRSLHQVISPLPCPLVWQVDGRPMSGDLGRGTTHATLRLAQTVAAANLPGYIQLAGGTNHHTVPALRRRQAELARQGQILPVAGVAYGSYARTQLAPLLARLPPAAPLEAHPELLWPAVAIAQKLVSQVKASGMLAASTPTLTPEVYSTRTC